jgi:hypothetical protein
MSSADDRPLNLSSKPQQPSARRRVSTAAVGQPSVQHGHQRQRNAAFGKMSPLHLARLSSPGPTVRTESRSTTSADERLYAERDLSRREESAETTRSTPTSFPSSWYPTMADIVAAAAAARSSAAGFPVDFAPSSSSALVTSCSPSMLLSQQTQHRSPFSASESVSSLSSIDRLQIGLQTNVSLSGARATSTVWNSPLSGNPPSQSQPLPSYAERCSSMLGANPHALPASPSLQAGVDRVRNASRVENKKTKIYFSSMFLALDACFKGGSSCTDTQQKRVVEQTGLFAASTRRD